MNMLTPGVKQIAVGAVFALVYAGMVLGRLPGLRLDRTGVALLGAIVLIGCGALSPAQAAQAVQAVQGVHLPTVLLLFAFMVLSAQTRLAGFYGALVRRLASLPAGLLGPAGLLAVVIAASGVLSAVFSNDVVCLAMAPVLARACLQRGVAPVPCLLALACASNIGSAATLIGNPQNMLIGEVLRLSFGGYLRQAAVPVVLGLLALWAWLAWPLRRAGAELHGPAVVPQAGPGSSTDALADDPAFDAWQTAKGLAVAAALVAVFLATAWPRDIAALVAAGLLLCGRRFTSAHMLALVDWPLLLLFIGLLAVNHAFEAAGLAQDALATLARAGLDLTDAATMFGATVLLSNLVSNVPAVMPLLPAVPPGQGLQAGALLALVSTLAGNLFIVGSIANIIVVDAARRCGVEIDWKTHFRTDAPVTALTLFITWAWLRLAP